MKADVLEEANKLTCWRLAEFARQLVRQDYVRTKRTGELLHRAKNMERGRGFQTNAELQEQVGTDANEEIEDLLA